MAGSMVLITLYLFETRCKRSMEALGRHDREACMVRR
jgi:hypothetical protein